MIRCWATRAAGTRGNGEPALAIFGRSVTPNLHALASRFVLLDNFYDCGEASATAGPGPRRASPPSTSSRTCPTTTAGAGATTTSRARTTATSSAASRPRTRTASRSRFTGVRGRRPGHPRRLRGTRRPHLGPGRARQDLTYRNYGFFPRSASARCCRTTTRRRRACCRGPKATTPGHGISDYDFRRFDTNYPDSDAPGPIRLPGLPD